jgi:glycosyltransferase involved in cell wall biosynthesis
MSDGARSAPKRMLYVHQDLGLLAGGGENYSRRLIPELVKRGYCIDLYYSARLDGSVPFAFQLPASVILKPLRGVWRRQLGQALLSALGQRLARARPDLEKPWKRWQHAVEWRTVYSHNRRFEARVLRQMQDAWASYDLAFVYANIYLAPKTARHLPTCLQLPGPLHANRLKWLEGVQVVCAYGDALLDLRQSLRGKRTVDELPLGLDTVPFRRGGANFREQLGWPAKAVVLGYVGRITVLKGVWLLARAFEALAPRWPELRLVMVGAGEELAEIGNSLRRAGLGQRICLPGVQKSADLPAWYRGMDLFIMPSVYENYSQAALEAMACGMPVLASRVGGNQIAVQEGRNGWLFESENWKDLAATLETALEQRSAWPAFGEYSQRRAQEQPRWAHVAEVFEDLMQPYVAQAGSGVAAG